MVNENKTWFLDFSEKGQMLDIPADSRPPIPVILGHLC